MEQRKVKSGLRKKGFTIEITGDHYWAILYDGDKPTIVRAKIGGLSKKKYKTLWDKIIIFAVKSLLLDDKKQFKDLVECPMSKEEYFSILNSRGIIINNN